MKTSHDNLTKKITRSGIFKLSDRFTPIGIKCLTSVGKAISQREYNFISFINDVGKIREMISEISFEMMKYERPANKKNLSESLLDDFDNELNSFFNGWGISADDLNPHFDKLKKKAKRIIKNQTTKQANKIQNLDIKETSRRDSMIYHIHNSLKKHTALTTTDINYYIAHLLIACEFEKGTLQTVFNKIDRAYYRYPKSPQM